MAVGCQHSAHAGHTGVQGEQDALVGVYSPRFVWVLVCPFGGEGEVVCDGVAEIAGDLSDEPSVGKIAFTHWIGRRSLRPAIRVGDLLWVRCRASSANREVDCVTGFW